MVDPQNPYAEDDIDIFDEEEEVREVAADSGGDAWETIARKNKRFPYLHSQKKLQELKEDYEPNREIIEACRWLNDQEQYHIYDRRILNHIIHKVLSDVNVKDPTECQLAVNTIQVISTIKGMFKQYRSVPEPSLQVIE